MADNARKLITITIEVVQPAPGDAAKFSYSFGATVDTELLQTLGVSVQDLVKYCINRAFDTLPDVKHTVGTPA